MPGWIVTADALESIAIGAGILGTGGGGNPYYGKLQARRLLDEGARIEVVSLDSIADDATVVSVGGMGAPTVSVERIPRGDESLIALRALEEHTGRRANYLIPGEIGGSNSTRPMVVGAMAGLPVLDGDGMGRAFPELQMDTFSIYGVPIAPATLADPRHNTVIFPTVSDAHTLERYARAVTIQMGGSAGYAFPIMSGAQAKATAVPGTMTLAREIGDAVRAARRTHADPVAAVLSFGDGVLLFSGKIVDIERRMEGGFARGSVTIEGLADDRGERLRIEFQNEYLVAERGETVLAVVPDLICIVDSETAEPVTTEILRYGLRVAVIGMPAPLKLKTPEALAVIGPAAFGYDVPYDPLPGLYGGDVPGPPTG
ncbi:MAG TPA: DUF917 domain-containing protein [Thermomicrobiales bacterium]|nr:DUF917 domain-containing protein [Thermomicrobiales bacterium]